MVVGNSSVMGRINNIWNRMVNNNLGNKKIKMKTILVTGAAGMIGSNLVHALLRETDHKVIGLDDFSGGSDFNLPDEGDRFKLYIGDICDSRVLSNIFMNSKRIDIIYHAAAYAAEGLSPFIRRFNYTNNLVGTASIVNSCIEHEVEKLVFFSSIAVYGKPWGDFPFKENDILCPVDPYGIAKYACEMDIRVAGEQHGLDWVIVRPFNVYGERQNITDKYRNVFGIWFYNYLNKLPLQIYGDGNQKRSFTYVKDIMYPLIALGELPECSRQIYNLGNDHSYTINEALLIFQKVVGPCEVQHLPPRHEVKNAVCNTDKVSRFDFLEHTSLETGLLNMWEWIQKYPIPTRRVDMPYEITNGLYENWK